MAIMEHSNICARRPGFTGRDMHNIAHQRSPYKLGTGDTECGNQTSAHVDIGNVDSFAEISHRGQDRAWLDSNVLAATPGSRGCKAVGQVRWVERQFVNQLLTL